MKNTLSRLACVMFLSAAHVDPLAAQVATESVLTVPVGDIVSAASPDAELLQLEATVTVRTQVVTDSDGTRRVAYSFSSAGTALGQTSQAVYDVTGSGSGAAPLDVPLPADAGLMAAFHVSRAETLVPFTMLLQGSFDADGRLSGLVVREITTGP